MVDRHTTSISTFRDNADDCLVVAARHVPGEGSAARVAAHGLALSQRDSRQQRSEEVFLVHH